MAKIAMLLRTQVGISDGLQMGILTGQRLFYYQISRVISLALILSLSIGYPNDLSGGRFVEFYRHLPEAETLPVAKFRDLDPYWTSSLSDMVRCVE